MFKLTLDQVGITADFSYQHKGHYLIALDLFKNNKIFGVGPKNFQNHCRNNLKYQKLPYVCTSHPHNTYFQILSETGFIGFFTIFSIFLYLCFLSILSFKNNILRIASCLLIFFMFILSYNNSAILIYRVYCLNYKHRT